MLAVPEYVQYPGKIVIHRYLIFDDLCIHGISNFEDLGIRCYLTFDEMT